MEIKVYTLKEVAEVLKVTERTLLTYIKEGKLKANKIGGKWIISQENLQNFINGN
jgi:excisionase family DNA binding protein